MTNMKIDDLQRTEELASSDMVRIVGGSPKEPAGKPTHIDALNGVLTFGDGSKWSMDLDGKLHPLRSEARPAVVRRDVDASAASRR